MALLPGEEGPGRLKRAERKGAFFLVLTPGKNPRAIVNPSGSYVRHPELEGIKDLAERAALHFGKPVGIYNSERGEMQAVIKPEELKKPSPPKPKRPPAIERMEKVVWK